MHNIMMNRSKMLIRRASTREGLLKKQREQELQSIEALSEDYPSQVSDRDVLMNKNRLRKVASSSYVLQEIPDNSSFSQHVHTNVGFSQDDNDNEFHSDKENGPTDGKLVVRNNSSVFTLDNATTMFSPSIGVTLGISFMDGNDNNNHPHKEDTFAFKTYRRSRSCGLILSLRYNLNDNDEINTSTKKDNVSDNVAMVTSPMSGKTEEEESDNKVVENDVHKFARSRSLLLLASRGRSLVNNAAKTNIDNKGVIQEGDERSVSRTDDASEVDINIGRFTKVFHDSEQDSATPDETGKPKSAETMAISNANTNKNKNSMPVIKPKLMPQNLKLDKGKEKERNGRVQGAHNTSSQINEFDSIAVQEDSVSSQKDTPRTGSSSGGEREPIEARPLSVSSNEAKQTPKMRRQGSVNPPKLQTAGLPADSEPVSISGCFKSKKSKKNSLTDKAIAQEHGANNKQKLRACSLKKTRGLSLSIKPSFLSGFYKSVLPPIHQNPPPKDSMNIVPANQTYSQSRPSPPGLAQHPSSDTSPPSFPDISASRQSSTVTKEDAAHPSNDSAKTLVQGQKRVHVSSNSDVSTAEEVVESFAHHQNGQLTGCDQSTIIISGVAASENHNSHTAPSSGYQSQTSLSDMSSTQLTDTECATPTKSFTTKPQNGASTSRHGENPSTANQQVTTQELSSLTQRASNTPGSSDKTDSEDTKSQVSREIEAVSKPRPARKCRKGTHQSQEFRLTGRCSALDIDVDLSPELFTFLTSSCAGRRGAICAVIDDMQGRPLSTVSSLVVMEDMMV